jgi:hypothetical protein
VSRYRVVPPYQVHHDGTTYGAGEQFSARDDMVEHEVGAGWLEKVSDADTRTQPAGKEPARKRAARKATS